MSIESMDLDSNVSRKDRQSVFQKFVPTLVLSKFLDSSVFQYLYRIFTGVVVQIKEIKSNSTP